MTTKPEEVEARKQKEMEESSSRRFLKSSQCEEANSYIWIQAIPYGRIIVKRVCELLTRASPDGIFRLPNG